MRKINCGNASADDLRSNDPARRRKVAQTRLIYPRWAFSGRARRVVTSGENHRSTNVRFLHFADIDADCEHCPLLGGEADSRIRACDVC